MDLKKEGVLFESTTMPAIINMKTPNTIPRLRKKLRKTATKQKNNAASWFGTTHSTEASTNNKHDTTTTNKPVPGSLPPPDLNDSKWSDFVKPNGCIYQRHSQSSTTASQEHLRSRIHIVPELSHLVTSDGQPRKSTSSDTAAVSPRPTTTMRRRAKTPIFSIGQLEDIPRPRNALGKTSSVELIAEQYRILLDSQSSGASIYSDSYSEPPPSRQGGEYEHYHLAIRRQQSSDHLRDGGGGSGRPNGLVVAGSPSNSDDGTLVSFEEETVYFKPVSFSSLSPASSSEEEAELSVPNSLHPLPPTPSAPDALSLQICLDLLTRDLSSALASRPSRSSPETSALQVWVMIEAYEKLRDELAEKRLGGDEAWALEGMLNTWLRALYQVHDSLTEGRQAQSSDSDYGAQLGLTSLTESVGV